MVVARPDGEARGTGAEVTMKSRHTRNRIRKDEKQMGAAIVSRQTEQETLIIKTKIEYVQLREIYSGFGDV